MGSDRDPAPRRISRHGDRGRSTGGRAGRRQAVQGGCTPAADPAALVDFALVTIKRGNETNCWPFPLFRSITVRTWHTGSAATFVGVTAPRPIGMILANPAGILAARTFGHAPDMARTPKQKKPRPATVLNRN